jgi:hypothetical protein
VSIVDDVVLDRERANAVAELRSEPTHPRLLGQQFESVDYRVNEPSAVAGLASSAT